MVDAAFWNIGMLPMKERVFRGQNPLLMNYSDEQLRQRYILMLIIKNNSKPFKNPIHIAKTMIFWLLLEKYLYGRHVLKRKNVTEKKQKAQRSLYRLFGLILHYSVKPFPNNAIIFFIGSRAKVWPSMAAMLKIQSASKSHNGKSVIQWLFPAIWFSLADWFQKRRWKKAKSL